MLDMGCPCFGLQLLPLVQINLSTVVIQRGDFPLFTSSLDQLRPTEHKLSLCVSHTHCVVRETPHKDKMNVLVLLLSARQSMQPWHYMRAAVRNSTETEHATVASAAP